MGRLRPPCQPSPARHTLTPRPAARPHSCGPNEGDGLSPLALPLGLLVGLTLGALGGGGAILTVPVLVYGLGQDPRAATTSSLLIVGITSLAGLVPHARAGNVRFRQGLVFGALGTAGSFAGSAASAAVPAPVLLTAFAALLLAAAVSMLRRSSSADTTASIQAHAQIPRRGSSSWTQAATVLATATLVGALTGFFGVGGGFLLVPALVLVLGYPMPVAVGTSLLVIAVNSATALAPRVGSTTGTGSLSWVLTGAFTGAAILGSLLGGRIATRANPVHLSRAFAVLLTVVALYTAARSAPALL